MRPVHWVGSALRDLKEFPRAVQRDIGQALYAAQCGEAYPSIKALKGFPGASVLEIVAPAILPAPAVAEARFAPPVSDPDVSRPRLIRDASFLEADRREIALRRGRHNRLGFAYRVAFVRVLGRFPQQAPLEIDGERSSGSPQLRAKVRRGLLKVEQLHALARAVYYGQRAEGHRRVLAALVGVMDDRVGPALRHGHLQPPRLPALCVGVSPSPPADDPAAEHVENDGQVDRSA